MPVHLHGNRGALPSPAHTAVVTAPRRGMLLAVLAVAQLMVIVDISAVNVALPNMAADLGIAGFRDPAKPWLATRGVLAGNEPKPSRKVPCTREGGNVVAHRGCDQRGRDRPDTGNGGQAPSTRVLAGMNHDLLLEHDDALRRCL